MAKEFTYANDFNTFEKTFDDERIIECGRYGYNVVLAEGDHFTLKGDCLGIEEYKGHKYNVFYFTDGRKIAARHLVRRHNGIIFSSSMTSRERIKALLYAALQGDGITLEVTEVYLVEARNRAGEEYTDRHYKFNVIP